MKPPGLSLNLEDVIEYDHHQWWGSSSETTYRQDGVSIGADYLRLEGTTITRGEIMKEHLEVVEEDTDAVILGRGAFSTVVLAKWRPPNNNKENIQEQPYIPVAVKRFSLSISTNQRRDMLLQELKALGNLRSPLLVHLHGAYLDQNVVTMVLELMDRGSLDGLLKHPTTAAALQQEPVLAPLAYQILAGVNVLHRQRILHRDLKPANILLHSTGQVKLCDFGLASMLQENVAWNTTVIGTSQFMAPERLRARPYGKASDLWSVGLVLWQCITGRHPWQNIHSLVELVVTVEETNLTTLIPQESTSRRLREIVEASLQQDPGT